MKFFIVDIDIKYLKHVIDRVGKHPKIDNSTNSEQIFWELVSILVPSIVSKEQYV